MKTAQAVELYRQLADHLPEAFLPSLMASQSRLAVLIAACGKAEEAVRAIEAAELTYRCCRPYCPTWTLAEWAKALGVIANSLRRSGCSQPAVTFATRAVETWHELALQHPGAFMPDLGRALGHLAAQLEECQRGHAAWASWAEAEEVYRSLAELEPGTFLPDLAVTLLNHAIGLSRASQWETGLLKAKQAETMFRSLAQAKPQEFLLLWARALAVEAACYRSLPDRAHEIEHYGREVISWWIKVHSHSTMAGTLPDVEEGSVTSTPVEARRVAG